MQQNRKSGIVSQEWVKTNGTISIHHEHGVFLDDELMAELNIYRGDPVSVSWHGLVTFEICRSLSDINPRDEAKAIFAAFEDIFSNHYSFLGTYEITKRLPFKAMLPFAFDPAGIYPELAVRRDSFFTFIYRKLEDALIELDGIPAGMKLPERVAQTIDALIDWLAELLEDLYENANCVIGAGTYLSLALRNVEVAFGISEIELSHESKIGYEKPISVNPYVFYWLINDLAYLKKKKISWNYYNFEIRDVHRIPYVSIDKIAVKTYLASEELWPAGANANKIHDYLYEELLKEKPFVSACDLLFPISCPSIVIEEKLKEDEIIPFVDITPFGPLPSGELGVPRISRSTKITIQFFDFPLFNRKKPVVLDTSALDVARFPFSIFSSFFETFLKGRIVIIPSAVLYETKTRCETKDRERVIKALSRLNHMKSWGFIRDVVQKGTIPELKIIAKRQRLEDLIDSIVLSTAIENDAILFTNDSKLAEYAFSIGIYAISYYGLEDDIKTVIAEHQGKYDMHTVIEAVQNYGRIHRGSVYDENDIKSIIEYLKRRGEIIEINGKLIYTKQKSRGWS